MLDIIFTNKFRKDYKKASKQGKDLLIVKEVSNLLASEIELPEKYKDHILIGNYQGKRECHIKPNWLLIYEVNDSSLILHRLGSHSELFK